MFLLLILFAILLFGLVIAFELMRWSIKFIIALVGLLAALFELVVVGSMGVKRATKAKVSS